MAHSPEDIRNLALVGAGGAGKTTLAESMLHMAKVTSRKGSVQEGNTVSDYDPDEKERSHSVLAVPVHLPWKGKHVNLIDAPGALDFFGEPCSALAAVEIAAICVSAHDGVGVATRRVFKAAQKLGLPCCIVITRCDSENVDGDALMSSIQQVFGERAVPLNVPDCYGPEISKVMNVFGEDIDGVMAGQVDDFRQQVTERVVEVDDALLERYFEEETVSREELRKSFPLALRQGTIIPILHVASETDVGVERLLDFIVNECPRPAGGVLRKASNEDDEPVEVDPSGPFAAQVWKIQVDPHVGKLAYLRVWSGSLASKTQVTPAGTSKPERIGDLLEIQGKEMTAVSEAVAGDLVAVAKVDNLKIGDTVHEGPTDWQFAPVATPDPKVTLAVEPKNRSDEAKLAPELTKLGEADATFVTERIDATRELVVRGLSSLHVDIMLKRLGRKKVEVLTRQPRVPYQETLGGKGDAQYRHKKQTGGRGQFAEVHLRVEPLPRGSTFEFSDEVVGGAIPRQFIPAVEKGIRETLVKGVFAGYPFTDVKATVYYGKFHDVDSDEHSFKLAAGNAFRQAVEQAGPVLLEPVMEVQIEVPSTYMGQITGDLNSRRGRILGMNQEGDTAIIQAQVPLAEMMQYSTELRSLTAGEGDYSFKFAHYEEVPAHVAQEVVARSKKQAQEA